MAISAQHTRFVSHDYISPLPAEDLIKVALKKQEMYDEGRQKIKQEVDKYQQLRGTIVNENALKYFDQEMGKFVKNVNENAGLDFANINNVEAVMNIGKPLENDKYIKIALKNGMEYQRRTKELSGMAKDKRNSDNDLVYMQDAQDYIQNGGLDTEIAQNKSYEQYIDISKKLADAEKEIPAETFERIEQGPQGYLKEVEYTRKRQQDIYERAMLGMTPAEQRQLQIHAQAEMYRMGDGAAYQVWVGHNKQEKILAETTRREALGGLSSLESIPPNQRTEAQKESIRQLQNIIESQESVINATKTNIEMNPDEFDAGEYTDLFTKRFLTGFSKKLAYENTKVDLKEDKVFLIGLEHRNKISQINAEGAQDRLTATVENDIENYNVASTSSLGILKGVPNLLSKDFKLDPAKTPQQQIDDVITQINNIDPKKLSAVNKNKYVTELASLKAFYDSAIRGATNSKIVLNRSSGLGRVETSASDLLTRSIFDVMASGNTIEVLQRNAPKATAAKETPEQKAAKTKAEIEAGFKAIYPDKSKVEIDKLVQDAMEEKLSK